MGVSTDGTVDIICKYLDKIDIFISEKDDGLYYAMNKGIKLASGEIIGILNSDDTFEIGLYDCSDIEQLWYRMAIPHPLTFVRKAVYDKFGLFDTQYPILADYDLMLRLYSEGARFGHIDVKTIEKIINLYRGQPGKKITTILNMGCGTGRHDFELTKLGYQMTGIDLSEEMIKVAQAIA